MVEIRSPAGSSLLAMASTSTTINTAKRALSIPHRPRRSKPTAFLGAPLIGLRLSVLPATARLLRWPNPSPRVSHPGFRASVQVPPGIRPGSGVETDKLSPDVRNRAMEAVDFFGGRVTIGDVSSRAGFQLNVTERALHALAADTGGFLEVSDEGDVLYVFPKDYRAKLAAKSFRMKVEPVLDKLKSASEYLIRVSFGTALIASIVLVYTTIIALVSSRSDEDNRGRRGSRSYDSGVTIFFSPSDLFWYWDPYYYRRRQMKTDEGMNFIESVFSFVFGDGDPNQGLEEKRWKLIGQYISSNGGVVTAEELAPYLDVEPTKKATDDDSYVLPVLLRFDGYPEVDDEGNILYRFPSLQRTASSPRVGRKEYIGKKWAEWVDGIGKYFEEKKWSFSKTSASEKAMVMGLGALNLSGVVILGSMLKNMTVAPSGFVSFVADIFPLLQIYAASFFAIPLFRWFLVHKRNAGINKRNIARKLRARALELPEPTLRRKLLSARDMARKTVIGSDRIVYSTEKDILDQDYEAKEWDRRFRELERSD
ncbi:Uncharacterized protein AXF42_Ash009257 [Apostasia shenzhenica]|uniref:Iron-sulfur cluster biosynthesis family protein n=1 Tax=Apostasia shenzhenica TaxID=1088818 RepID=A0A2I0B3K0_9ASPA|nr:Uncharacterized protein AXF42_Ash009257 [Apostasia shenzhenica]